MEAARRSGVERYPAWLPWAVLALGAALRLFRLDDWSLWFDEETSIYFALNPGRPFPRSFPLYFWLLGRVFALTGVSVYSARLLSALAGILTLWLAWRCIRRFCGDEVALPALVLLVLSPGHLFWSQSIRYYTLALVFQLASVDAFLRALDRPTARLWTMTAFWLLLASVTSITTALLIPVYVIVAAWMVARRRLGFRWSWGPIVLGALGLAFSMVALSTLLWLSNLFGPQRTAYGMALFIRFVAYAGVPAVALMFAAIVLARQPSTGFVFFLFLAVVPVVELILLRQTGLWKVAWYHGFMAVVGVAAIGGYGWQALTERMSRPLLACAGAVVLCASLAIVISYFTTAFGDRPRWREAAGVLTQHQVFAMTTGVDVFSDAPGVIAYYVGVPPDRTMGHPLVRLPPWPVSGPVLRETWFVLEARLAPPAAKRFLSEACNPAGEFPAHLIVRDRTVLVYHCTPDR